MKSWIKKLITVVVLCGCLSVFAVGATAITVDLTKDQTHVFSSTIYDTYAFFYGSNSAASERDVAFISQYKTGLFTWNDDAAHRDVSPGENCPDTKTFTFSENKSWRLQLNPIGADTKGCSATGTII